MVVSAVFRGDMIGHDQLKRRIIAWATQQVDIRVMVQVGSLARTDHPGDEWSDLDIMIFSTDPQRYLTGTVWLEDIDELWTSMRSRTVGGDDEQLVVFSDGNRADFVIMDYRKLDGIGEMAVLPEIFLRGIDILLDRDNLLTPLLPATFYGPSYEKPSVAGFRSLADAVWFAAVSSAKLLRRGNLYEVKLLENRILADMTSFIELHTHATRGWRVDTWYGGHFIDEWADPRVLEALSGVYSQYNLEDNWRALFARMDLHRWMIDEIAEAMGFEYSDLAYERCNQFVKDLYSART
jgi:aminoglycoside 6-adenylyltransferase